MKLTAIYGPLFISKYGIEDDGVWFAALKDLTPKALLSGVERLMSLSQGDKFCDFPPNCLQFRTLCLSFYGDLRLPSVSDAHREVVNRAYLTQSPWSHPAVQFTANRLGLKFLEMTNPAASFARFKAAYEQVCHLVRQGHPIPVIKPVSVARLPSKEVATSHLAAMRQSLTNTRKEPC